MSEEILKALTQLFAIITKQDEGASEIERSFVIEFFQQELDQSSIAEYTELYDSFIEKNKAKNDGKKRRTSVRDSVRTLAICKKINKTLTQKQKVIVLMKILELIKADNVTTETELEIVDTIASVFNISKEEFSLSKSFVLEDNLFNLNDSNYLLASDVGQQIESATKQITKDLDGALAFVKIPSVDMYFVTYHGDETIVLNGFDMNKGQSYLFSQGSTIKTQKGDALYYSDLITQFSTGLETGKIAFEAKNVEYKFANGNIGLRDINIGEDTGRLIGIMGASGAGKTTLLNVLAGIEKPTGGSITINGFDINKQNDQIQGTIGYVSQDDLLIDELTVYDNLYYNAKLCFANLNEEELDKKVINILTSLGLDQRKDLRVGNVHDKTISGGQRKRLNIALELIREPGVLFVDEPTSGLSSRDSENVVDLLKELSLKGKLIFVVIHQPSSEIYKMFDKMMIMDTGGFPVFYGNPVEGVTYFKQASKQVGSERGQCGTCGNVNPEQIFNILEAQVVDEYGQFTGKRKITPKQWHEKHLDSFQSPQIEVVTERPPNSLQPPSGIKQTIIFATRDILSKISNKQYLLINLLEAPVLAFILAFIIKYKSEADGSEYLFRFNENIPAYLMMSIIVALFMGLSVSAEEIIKDRTILKRESFLNLSWNSYLLSKVGILFLLSAIQTLTFVLVGNSILEIKGMYLSYWLVLFSVSCFANLLGLNASSSVKSAIAVYILIPLLIIPQMILSGLLFNFDKLNEMISSKNKVPVVADLMASRWAFEALAVKQFRDNEYQKPFYDYEKEERKSDFKTSYLLPKLEELIGELKIGSDQNELKIEILRSELTKLGLSSLLTGDETVLTSEKINEINQSLSELRKKYLTDYKLASQKKEAMVQFYENSDNKEYDLDSQKDNYHNESLNDLVRNINAKERILPYKGELIQQIDPIFHDPIAKGSLGYRSHFYAPKKHFAGTYFDTFKFNIVVIWLMTLALYITLLLKFFPRVFRKLAALIPIKK